MQQQNFKDILSQMLNIDGWSILEDGNLLALKSPASIPLVNFVWGDSSVKRLHQVKDFFGDNEFYWLLSKEQNQTVPIELRKWFSSAELFPEMILDFNSFNMTTNSSKISVTQAMTDDELQLWVETAIATFGFTESSFKEFFYPLIKCAKCIPLLLYYDEKPAATAMIYCDSKSVAGIYAMSTKTEFRRKGLGRAAINACIELAKRQQLEYAVLYASVDGEALYNQLGFESSQIWHEYHFAADFTI